MYLKFYGLSDRPFRATPDPRFLYLSARHREVMAQLTYGVREGMGFMLLTGEVGTGKTTLLHSLLRQMDEGTAASYVFNSSLSFDDLIEYIVADLGVAAAAGSRAQRLFGLNNYLLERHRAGLKTVLVLDEAHHLSVDMLERIRLLSNFETYTSKLFQIILAGQPELTATLRSTELRSLRQRIALRVTLAPLSPAETRDYVRARLRIAGTNDLSLFTESALREVAERTGGIPRLVNIVCDHALLLGYADQRHRIDAAVVKEAAEYAPEEGLPRGRTSVARHVMARTVARWSLAAVATVIVAAGVTAAVLGAHASSLSDLAEWARKLAMP